MNFNSKVLNPITKSGALKSFNTSGVKVDFKSVSNGHTFGGSLGDDGTGKLTYKGNWYGMDLSKELGSNGARKISVTKKKEFCH